MEVKSNPHLFVYKLRFLRSGWKQTIFACYVLRWFLAALFVRILRVY